MVEQHWVYQIVDVSKPGQLGCFSNRLTGALSLFLLFLGSWQTHPLISVMAVSFSKPFFHPELIVEMHGLKADFLDLFF